jgi:hypothetical protein
MKTIYQKTTAIFALLAVFIGVGVFAAVSVDKAEAASPVSCPYSGGIIVNFDTSRWLAGSHDNRGVQEIVAGANIPAGNYSIAGTTWDDHSGHGGQGQQEEQMYVQFQNSGGGVVAQTGFSADIPENSDSINSTLSGGMYIGDGVTRAVAKHKKGGTAKNAESVYPICIKLNRLDPPAPPAPDPTPTASCSVSDSTVEEGDSVTFNGSASGGTPGYTYSWSGAVSGNSQNESTSFNNTGTYTATLTVTDSKGKKDTDTCTVRVEAEEEPEDDFEITCRVSDTRVDVDEEVEFSVDIDGGNSPFEYDWNGDIEGEDDDESTLEVRYDDDGRYYVSVTVEDDDGRRRTDECPTVVVEEDDDDDLDIQCRVSDTRIEVGDRITIEVDIDGGDSPYDIEWDGDIDDIDDFDDNDESQRVEFDEDGRYYIEVTVEDDDGNRESDDCPVIVVDDDDDNRDINVITNTTPTGTLSGIDSVFLSQVPYTGPAEDLAKVLSFTFLLLIWSAIITTVFYKRRIKSLQSQRIEQFKQANLNG